MEIEEYLYQVRGVEDELKIKYIVDSVYNQLCNGDIQENEYREATQMALTTYNLVKGNQRALANLYQDYMPGWQTNNIRNLPSKVCGPFRITLYDDNPAVVTHENEGELDMRIIERMCRY